MVEGSASLMTAMYGALAAGRWVEERGRNRLDKGAHSYNVYETQDGNHVSVGAIAPQFYHVPLKHPRLEAHPLPPAEPRSRPPEMRQGLAAPYQTNARHQRGT